MMWTERTQKAASPDEQVVMMSRRLSLRWKLLQIVGTVLIALSVFFEWQSSADTSLPQTSSFLLVLGALVLLAGLIADKWSAGPP